MDQTISREKDLEFDLESGGNTSEEDESRDPDSSEKQSKNLFGWSWNWLPNFDASKKHETAMETCCSSSKLAEVMDEDIPLRVDPCLEDVHRKLPHVKDYNGIEKNKKTNSKPPKPPRPPKGPLLDAADKKLVQEIAEIALRKRERIKKIKAVRMMKAKKASSSLSYTGINSGRSAAVGVMTSPEPSITTDEGLISVHFVSNFTHEVVQGK